MLSSCAPLESAESASEVALHPAQQSFLLWRFVSSYSYSDSLKYSVVSRVVLYSSVLDIVGDVSSLFSVCLNRPFVLNSARSDS